MRLLSRFALALGWALAAAAAPPLVELDSNLVRAADLAPAASAFRDVPGEAVLGRAPSPGVTRSLSRTELSAWARSASLELDPAALPEAVLLRRRMRRLSAEELREHLRRACASRLGVSPGRVVVQASPPAAATVPSGELRFSVSGALQRLNEPVRLHLRWTEAGGRSGLLAVEATLRIRGRYLTAVRDLAPRQEVSLADFTEHDEYLPSLRVLDFDPARFPARATLNRSLAAGAPLERTALEVRKTVERGDLLELTVARGGVRLRVSARAESSGETGAVIACRNLGSGKRVSARVLGSNLAEALRR